MPDADGALQLRALGLRMKELSAAGNLAAAEGLGSGRTLRAQLLGAIRAASKPAVQSVKDAARTQLPKRGGLNDYIANEKIKTGTRLTGPRVGVRITASSGNWSENQTSVRHPVFGNRKRWAVTPIASPGWFTETLQHEVPAVTAAIRIAMEAVAAEATRRI